MHDLGGRTAIVTGGASGVGRATVSALLASGASVAVADRDASLIETIARESDAGPDRFVASVVDVTSEGSLDAFVRGAAEQLGAPSMLVTAAGIQHYGDTLETSRWEWERVFSVNVTGTFLAVKAALPFLRESEDGSLVVVSSVQSIATQQSVAAYTSSKGALTAMVRSLAVDEARFGVRANAVLPGSVDTPMLRASARRFSDGSPDGEQELVETWGRSHPLGRVARPDEIAATILFLLGPYASFVTGVSLPVDGGLLAGLAVGLPE